MTAVPYTYEPTPKQTLAHTFTDVDELLFGGSAGGGKDLSLSTPVLTTRGWSTQGDLQAGDEVFDQDGKPTLVVRTHDVESNPCYRITFTNGESIVAGEGHQWNVATDAERMAFLHRDPQWQAERRENRASRAVANSQKPWVSLVAGDSNTRRADAARTAARPPYVWDYTHTVKTREIADLVAAERRSVSVPLGLATQTTGPWQSKLPGWVMGMWLGDGDTAGGNITHGPEDAATLVETMAAHGYRLHLHRKFRFTFTNVRTGNTLNHDITAVFGMGQRPHKRSKHIPDWVYTASFADRLAVVQGLMDSDGSAQVNGRVELCLTNERLFRDAARLLSTLGIRVTVSSGEAGYRLAGVRKVTGVRWRAQFSTDVPVFTYQRKLARLNAGRSARRNCVYVQSVEAVPTVPTRCITVANPRGLYLVGNTLIPTHNSRWGRAEAIRHCLLVPGIRIVIFRRTFPELERAVVEPLRLEMPAGVARYNDSKHVWRFTNGSILELAYLDSDSDVLNYQGAEYGLCVFEELTQFTEKQYRYMLSRLRVAGAVKDRMAQLGWRPRVLSTSNPGGPGHGFVKARFIDPGIRGRVWQPEPTEDDEDPGTRCYVPARVVDNPHIDPGYIRQLNRQEPVMRRALRDGDWDILEGVRFSQFRRAVHVIEPEDFPIPMVGYPRAVGVDYGSEAPFCALWGALLPDNMVIVYRELYETGLTPRQQADRIAQVEDTDERIPGRPIPIALDPSTWIRAATQVIKPPNPETPPPGSIAWYYRERFGGQVVKARNDRVPGWALVDEHLRVRIDPNPLPRLLIFSNCTNLIRTLPAQMRSKTNPEDVDTKGEDHAADALRYLLMQLVGGGHDRTTPNRRPTVEAPMTAGINTQRF